MNAAIFMKKSVLLICAFLFLFFLPVAAHAWVDPTLCEHAAALDKARGWDKPGFNKCGKPITCANPQTPEEEGSINAEGIGSNFVDTTSFNFGSKIMGVGRTLCTDPEITTVF